MNGASINTTHTRHQRDVFDSGTAARVGADAFVVWLAVKHHANYSTGLCHPGMRRLSKLTGVSLGRVCEAIKILADEKLLRVVKEGKGSSTNRYIARERIDVKIGKTVLCTIVIDYVPTQISSQLTMIDEAMKLGEMTSALAECEIIPGRGFVWDSERGLLSASINVNNAAAKIDEIVEKADCELVKKVKAIRREKRK